MPRTRYGRGRVLAAAALAVLLAACSGGGGDGDADGEPATSAAALTTDPTAPASSVALAPLQGLTLAPVATGLEEPVDVVLRPGDGALLVVERVGVVRLVEDAGVASTPFADLRTVVKSESIEQGLLGMTFHPRYPTDRRVFVYHSIRGNDNVLASYRAAADGRGLDAESRVVLLTIDKEPDSVRHNGGTVRFGPDGMLYVSVGDAARASVNGQDPKTLPGSVLRIDVDAKEPYAVPSDNPFADGVGGAPEVWWYGLRNPWRVSIDAESGWAYVADVGQEAQEEVNVVRYDRGGLNFGWPLFQGANRYSKGEPSTALTDPVLIVRHDDESAGCSITGGEVYRGRAIPELDGHYFYADWCNGWIRSFRWDGAVAVDRKDWSDQLRSEMVSAFGHDADGELLVVDHGAGTLWRVTAVRGSSPSTSGNPE